MNRYRIMHRGSDSVIESIMNTLINVLSHVVDVDVLQDYMLRFEEQNGEYTIQRETDIFKELENKTWVSHRNGGLSSQSQEIPLAKYMGKTLENKLYKAYYAFYTGFDASEANTNTRGAATYASISNIQTYTTHAGTANDMERDYTATGCRGSNMDGTDTVDASLVDLGIISSTLTASTPRQQYKYTVEGTYRAKDRTADTGKSQQLHEEGTHNGKTYINQIFEAPSNTFTFYPTYKMYYSSELGKQPNSTAWMLSAGRRTYRATDVIKIEVTGGDTDVWAPWSRDWQDKYTEDSKWGFETDRGYSVIKSGMVVRAVASPIQIRITGAFSIQDPDFAPDGMQSAVAAMNANKEAEMTKAVNKIADDLTPSAMAGEGMSYGFYSNLWEATSENVVAAYALNPLVKVDFDGSKILNYYHSESPKTRLNIANSDASDYSRTEYYAQHRLSTDILPTEGILGSIFGTLTGEKLVNDITINGHKAKEVLSPVNKGRYAKYMVG